MNCTLNLVVSCLTLARVGAYGQAAEAPSFEVASVRPSSSEQVHFCSGGPGTASPGLWRCTGLPLAFFIRQAYGFEAYQFSPGSYCCQARFDIAAKVPEGTTKEQFRQMLRNLLAERLKLKFHYEQKEMAIFELTVGRKGLQMKESAPDAAPAPEDPWAIPEISIGKDGCPVFSAGKGGLRQGRDGCTRWIGFDLSMEEIVKTLSFNLGRKVVDATGLKGKYDIDIRWWFDEARTFESLTPLEREQIGRQPDEGFHGPTLIHAVRDQLGLELISKKGSGDIVVVDHFEKVPTEN
jgi:uncharacterized protein (TIGR03435 family)